MSKAAQELSAAVSEIGKSKKERPAKAKAEKAPRSVTAGLRTAPKIKAVLVSSPASRAVALKALNAFAAVAAGDDLRETQRLIARFESRQP